MQGEQGHSDQIKKRDEWISEANHHHLENIVAFFRIRKIHEILSGQVYILYLNREMEGDINDKCEHTQAAHERRARGIPRSHGLVLSISYRSGGSVFRR